MAGPDGTTRLRSLGPGDDLVALTDLLHRAYAVQAARGLMFVATGQDVDTTRRRCARGDTVVACDADRVVGTVTWYEPGPDPDCPLYREPDLAHFGQFAVEPAMQGRGIGRALLSECERRAVARGFRRMACDTAAPAADLVARYEAWGYQRAGRVRWPRVNYESVLLVRRLDAAPQG